MSYLHRIRPRPGALKKGRRRGRGPGTGRGKTSGRGHKGQMQHGSPPRQGFEGGQMPILRTMPKRGFSARSRAVFQVVNLERLKEITAEVVNGEVLYQRKLIRNRRQPVKILGDGELKKPVTVQAHAFSRSARAKIEKAGGRAEVVGRK